MVVDLNPRHQGGYACNGLALQAKGISLTDVELSALLGEEVELSQSELDEKLDFAWSHSKVIPYEKGQAVHAEYQRSTITEPFSSIGQSFVTEFYKQGSVFIEGYIGYQVHTANERSELEATMLRTREEFDSHVLGL